MNVYRDRLWMRKYARMTATPLDYDNKGSINELLNFITEKFLVGLFGSSSLEPLK